jgi:lipopolysaccharide export system protein LptC
MKPFYVVALIVVIFAAITVGWVYQSRSKLATVSPELEIPTDIDYFLAELKYQIINKTGSLDYQLNSPYLEHFPRDDISLIRQPVIDVYRETGDWNIQAQKGELNHQQNLLLLSDDVVVKRLGANALQISAESMLFEPDRDLITSDKRVVIESDNSRVSGDMAVFDLHNQVYSMKNTRSIYNHDS